MTNDELITKTYEVLNAIIVDGSLSEFELIDMKHYLFRCFQILELSKLHSREKISF